MRRPGPGRLVRTAAAVAAGAALLGAAPGATPDPAQVRRDTEAALEKAQEKSRTSLPPQLVRPPADEARYELALARLLAAPASEVFAFAAWEGRFPEENLGADLKLGRAAVRMATLQIDAPPAQVLAAYRDRLSPRYGALVGRTSDGRGAHLSLRDPADGFMRSLVVLPAEQGTMVVASAGDPARIAPPDDASVATGFPEDLPMPPLAAPAADQVSRDGPFVQYARTAMAVERRPDDLAPIVLDLMQAQGWAVDPDSMRQSSPLHALVFTKPQRRCTITIAPPARGAPGCPIGWLCVERRP